MNYRKAVLTVIPIVVSIISYAQGVGIPSQQRGIGFGNLPTFSGIRFNFADKHVKKISGINVTIWQTKYDSLQTGTMHGISLGLPLAIGTETKAGIGVGIFGVGARKNLTGLNLGGFGAGAGGNMAGFNVGGLGIGAGGNLRGINIGGLGAGAGGDVYGINFGGLGVGAGGNLSGLNFGGLGAGSGGNISGVTFGGLGMGAKGNITGISIASLGIGAGATITGITIAGLGVGSGKELRGIIVSGLVAGSPSIKAITIAPFVGGKSVKGFVVAPFHLSVASHEKSKKDGKEIVDESNIIFKGVSASLYNRVNGDQHGILLGAVNYTKKIRGIQIGLINIVKENPRGLRVLPILNMRFGRKSN